MITDSFSIVKSDFKFISNGCEERMNRLGLSRAFDAVVRAILESGEAEDSIQNTVCPILWDGVGPWLQRVASSYRDYMNQTDIDLVFSSPGISKSSA